MTNEEIDEWKYVRLKNSIHMLHESNIKLTTTEARQQLRDELAQIAFKAQWEGVAHRSGYIDIEHIAETSYAAATAMLAERDALNEKETQE